MTRLVARVLAWGAPLGRGPRALLLVAALALVLAYCGNRDMAGQPDAPRGDGVYRPVLARGDGHLSFLLARSLLFDGDLRLENDFARFGDPFGNAVPGQRARVPHPIGPPLFWIPLLALAQGAAVVANALGAELELHGYTEWHQRTAFAWSPLAALVAVALGAALAFRLGAGRWAAAAAAAAILWGTSLTYYATFMPSYAHALDAGTAAAFLFAWARSVGRWDWQRAVGLGALLGVAALVRTQELALGVVLLVEVVVAWSAPPAGGSRWRFRARVLALAAASAATAALLLLPQLWVWYELYGAALALPQGPSYTRPAYPRVAELLFAARNGWFAVHPLAYAAVLGLLAACLRGAKGERVVGAAMAPPRRLICLALLAAVAVQVYLGSIILDWWGQAAFGQRRLCSMTLPLVVGLALGATWAGQVLVRWRAPRLLIGALAVLSGGWFVAWNVARVMPLRGGRPANFGAGPACCRQVGPPLSTVAQPVYDAVGNPFALPASALFALRHGVPLARWDAVQGDYPWVPAIDYTREGLAGQVARWPLGGPRTDKHALRGLAKGSKAHGLRWTTAPRAEILVPNLLPEPLELALRLVPNGAVRPLVVVRWNGREVARQELASERVVRWQIRGDVGDNLLVVEAPVAAAEASARALGATGQVGVALGELTFTMR